MVAVTERSQTSHTAVPPIVHRNEVRTTDPEVAHEVLRADFNAGRSTFSGDRTAFRFRQDVLAVDGFAMHRMDYSMSAESASEPIDLIYVSHVHCGRHHCRVHGSEHALAGGDLIMIDGAQSYRGGWSDICMEMLQLDRAIVRAVAAELSGHDIAVPPLAPTRPASPAHARYWGRLVDHVKHDVLADDAVASSSLVRTQTTRQLAVALLATFPNPAFDAVYDTGPARGLAEPATVRRAIAYMDQHAGENITLTDIADAARISPRGLQHAFRRHRGTTPVGYLRQVRMDGVHRALQDADPTAGDTVAVIAARWGFAHAGRFSVEYRRTFGCPPGRTLRS